MDWHHAAGDEAQGPIPEEELRRLLASGELPPDTLVWRPGLSEWMAASQHPDLRPRRFVAAPSDDAALPPLPAEPSTPVSRTRPWPLTLLAVLWGLAGIFLLVGAVALLVALGVASSRGESTGPVGALAMLLAMGGLGLLFTLASIGVWKLRSWGRTCAITVAAIGLLAVPLGTIINALILAYLLSGGVRVLFSGRSPEELDAGERDLLRQLPTSGLGTATGVVTLVALALWVLILPAIAIPNFLNAIQRGKQKRTASDMVTVATALEAWSVENAGYPPTDGWVDLATLVPGFESASASDLPANDAWDGPLRYRSDGATYQLVSAGRDGLFQDPPPSGTVDDYAGDLVIETGEAVAWPENVAQGRFSE